MDSESLRELSESLNPVIEAVYRPFPVANPASLQDQIDDPELREIALLQLCYLRGDFSTPIEFHLQQTQPAKRLVSAGTALPSAINLGDALAYRKITQWLRSLICEDAPAQVRAFAEHVLATGQIGARQPESVPAWIRHADYVNLHPLARFDANAQRAGILEIEHDYEGMLATAKTTIYFAHLIERPGETSIVSIGLYLRAALACVRLGRIDEADLWINEAISRALPHGYYVPFAEHLIKFEGRLERLISREYPEWVEPTIELAQQLVPNWLEFRSVDTSEDNLSARREHLTVQELEIAYCAASGERAAEIAKKFYLTEGTVRNKLRRIYDKLGIHSTQPKAELADYFWGIPLP